MEDVAKAARVSLKTVSRVFNGSPNVRARTREQVEAAAKMLDFSPNMAARGLVSNRSYLIAFLFDNLHAGSTYIMELVVGMLQACEGTAYNAILRPLDLSQGAITATEDFLAKYRPEALIITPPILDDQKMAARLNELNVRYSAISAKSRQVSAGVVLDERRATVEMMAHLTGLGHRRIAHIMGRNGHAARAWRLAGYKDGLRKAGIAPDPTLVVEGNFSFASGVAAARHLLSLADPPTAIFAANDEMACGVMREAMQRGMKIPDDISICGFDDSPASSQVWPSLTTIRQPCREMGRIATEQALLSIREPDATQLIKLDYEIVLRDSCGPANPKPGKLNQRR